MVPFTVKDRKAEYAFLLSDRSRPRRRLFWEMFFCGTTLVSFPFLKVLHYFNRQKKKCHTRYIFKTSGRATKSRAQGFTAAMAVVIETTISCASCLVVISRISRAKTRQQPSKCFLICCLSIGWNASICVWSNLLYSCDLFYTKYLQLNPSDVFGVEVETNMKGKYSVMWLTGAAGSASD